MLDGIGELTHDGEGGVLHHVVYLVDGARAGCSRWAAPKAARPDSTVSSTSREVLAVHLDHPDPCSGPGTCGRPGSGVGAARSQVGDAGHGLLLLGLSRLCR